MKHIVLVSMLALFVFSCKTKEKEPDQEIVKEEIAYLSIGENITDEDVNSTKEIAETYKSMTIGDTIATKMTAKVIEVCQSKGCWMTLNLDNGDEVMVKFKDYGFFMPKDIAGKDVILNGKAYVNEVPVDEQRHYAEDAGKSVEEIAAITMPKKTYSFEADGVLIKE